MRALEAIENITRETGFAPTPEELADALDLPLRALHSHLTPLKRAGVVRYDDDGRLVVVTRP